MMRRLARTGCLPNMGPDHRIDAIPAFAYKEASPAIGASSELAPTQVIPPTGILGFPVSTAMPRTDR